MTAPAPYNNHSLVGEALRLLAAGLGPYVSDKMSEAVDAGRYTPDDSEALGEIAGDISVTLRVMAMAWNDVFRDHLGPAERSLVSEIRETRNRWAHQDAFDDDDLDRALDSIGRLLAAVGAINEAKRIDGAKHRLRLRRYGTPAAQAARMPPGQMQKRNRNRWMGRPECSRWIDPARWKRAPRLPLAPMPMLGRRNPLPHTTTRRNSCCRVTLPRAWITDDASTSATPWANSSRRFTSTRIEPMPGSTGA